MAKAQGNTRAPKIADLKAQTSDSVQNKARHNHSRVSVDCSACMVMADLIREQIAALEEESSEASQEARRCWAACEYSGYEAAKMRRRIAEKTLQKCRSSLEELEACIGDPMARDSHFRSKNPNWR